MSKIVIKKRVSLDFLGEGYEKAYLLFQSIPLKDYDTIINEFPKESEKSDTKNDIKLILSYLRKYFLGGKFPNDKGELEDVTVEELDNLDQETAVKCFMRITGQELDPKSETPLSNQSSMEPDPQTNS